MREEERRVAPASGAEPPSGDEFASDSEPASGAEPASGHELASDSGLAWHEHRFAATSR
ncbi:MAG: hypothetical protein ACRDL0_23650 [Thermoleophilaceae bacterium]